MNTRDETTAGTVERSAVVSTTAPAVVAPSTSLSFTMPTSGYALYLSDTETGARVFDVDSRELGVIDGRHPQRYYGKADGVVVERDDGLWLARPGARELVSAPSRYFSGWVVPGWKERGACFSHPERPSLEMCEKEIVVRDGNGATAGSTKGNRRP